MNRGVATLCSLAVLCAGGTSGFAEDAAAVVVDARVRVEAPSVEKKKLVGRVVAVDEQTVTLQIDPSSWDPQPWEKPAVRKIPVEAIRSLEVQRRGPGSAGKGALIGAGVGAAIDVAFIAGLSSCQGDDCGISDGTAFLGGMLVPIGAGALLGALIGTLPADHWQAVPLREHRVSLALGPTPHRGFRAAVTFGF